ncbi:MAG: hypothetical protein HON10_02485 [Euryarchaeota archaeon]|jgi:hypothetical protein|nr:hypothetical protein [Euryarchaeota archaeon]MBT7987101.1 hypothetical protein [Euryarchaeota archaeon]
MANLWSFFGLPDPDGSVKKQKKSSGKKPESQPVNELTTNRLTQQTIVEIESETPALLPAPTERKPIPAKSVVPLNWNGPLTADGEAFHDLGVQNLARRSFPSRALRYIAPNEKKQIPTRGIAQRVTNGDTVIVDLRSMFHMDSHQNACRRELKMMSEEVGVGIFALDSEDKLLMIPGSDVIVDTGNHDLGISTLMN